MTKFYERYEHNDVLEVEIAGMAKALTDIAIRAPHAASLKLVQKQRWTATTRELV